MFTFLPGYLRDIPTLFLQQISALLVVSDEMFSTATICPLLNPLWEESGVPCRSGCQHVASAFKAADQDDLQVSLPGPRNTTQSTRWRITALIRTALEDRPSPVPHHGYPSSKLASVSLAQIILPFIQVPERSVLGQRG